MWLFVPHFINNTNFLFNFHLHKRCQIYCRIAKFYHSLLVNVASPVSTPTGVDFYYDAMVLVRQADECERTRLKGRVALVGAGALDRPYPATTISTLAKVSTIGAATCNMFKRLTEIEYAAKRACSLCFLCDDKFTPGHRCENPSIQVLMVEEWYATPSCEEERYVDDTMKENIHLDHIEISLRSGRMTNIEPNHQVARLH